MRAVQPTDGFCLHGWMRTELGLKGAELFTYALVHQFTQSSAGVYCGGIRYLSEWLGCSYNSALKYLKALVGKGLITETKGTENGVPFCRYTANLGVVLQILGNGTANFGDKNIKENINNTLSIKARTRFVKPSVQEIADYCRERMNDVDADTFYNFYEAKGWVVGKSPMKDWKAAVRTWEKRPSSSQPQFRPAQKESVLSHNLKVMDQMFGTNLHQQAYGEGHGK